jgi:hypothetical protein
MKKGRTNHPSAAFIRLEAKNRIYLHACHPRAWPL